MPTTNKKVKTVDLSSSDSSSDESDSGQPTLKRLTKKVVKPIESSSSEDSSSDDEPEVKQQKIQKPKTVEEEETPTSENPEAETPETQKVEDYQPYIEEKPKTKKPKKEAPPPKPEKPDTAVLHSVKIGGKGNLPESVTQINIRSTFGKFGEIGDVFMPRDHRKNKSRGFAYVRFLKEEDQKKCLEAAKPENTIKIGERGHGFEAEVEYVKPFVPNPERKGFEKKVKEKWEPRVFDKDSGEFSKKRVFRGGKVGRGGRHSGEVRSGLYDFESFALNEF